MLHKRRLLYARVVLLLKGRLLHEGRIVDGRGQGHGHGHCRCAKRCGPSKTEASGRHPDGATGRHGCIGRGPGQPPGMMISLRVDTTIGCFVVKEWRECFAQEGVETEP
ncbi:unnamed protein product [Laminaria digitata]